MLNNNIFTSFIFLFSIILFLACGGEQFISKKKISRSNPTYININFDRTSEFIKWKDESHIHENIYYSEEKSDKNNYPLLVKLRQLKPKKILEFNTAPLFLLDTSAYNASGYLAYTENPKYFETLASADAHFNLQEEKIIGIYKQELLDLGLSYKNIAFLLMQFGIIDTYDHLYSEMIISDVKNTADYYQIHYNCVYHICTSDCFDPKYKFSIRFDKKNKEISIMP